MRIRLKKSALRALIREMLGGLSLTIPPVDFDKPIEANNNIGGETETLTGDVDMSGEESTEE